MALSWMGRGPCLQLKQPGNRVFAPERPSCLGASDSETVFKSFSVLVWPKKGEGGSFSTLLQGEKRPSSITHHP